MARTLRPREFAAAVKNSTELGERKLTAVMQHATLSMIEEMQTIEAQGGKLPFRTGRLRGSLITEVIGGIMMKGATAFRFVIRNFNIGQTLRATFSVNYAAHLEYGTKHPTTGAQMIHPRLFVYSAAKNWGRHVANAVNRVRGMK